MASAGVQGLCSCLHLLISAAAVVQQVKQCLLSAAIHLGSCFISCQLNGTSHSFVHSIVVKCICVTGGLAADSTWQQVYVQDDGVALLAAVQQQGQLQLWLWRQLSSSSDQQTKAWQQLPAIPAHAGIQSNSTPQDCIQAVFVQQGFSGLQVHVAHATTAADKGAAAKCLWST
jgi:hypothetical protein